MRQEFSILLWHPDLFRLMAWYGLEQKVDNLTERASVQQKEIKELMNAQNAGLVGTTFTPGILLTAVMALATVGPRQILLVRRTTLVH
ncbi:hypothetical protein [Paenibacillus brasilensis]|uniref:HTH-type transcriptional repressor Sco4008 C-terminal domain-containing protein n=1 Tax=Paenibacillus brasilensis TaxID=128574 RepID=A0ABU0L7F1_9BACL|nr:hypothetical protein [Paenibacillus brasilensis]MDQ0497236.1 hypothetical protein [Paenibacillus brasilensis]